MLNFDENKFTITHFLPITVFFILFRPTYLAFGCVFPFILALLKPPGSGSNADPDTNT
jgi:hypothetical protein